MSIRKNVLKVKRQMLIEIDEPGQISLDVQQKALKAVSQGQASDAWKEYMTMFVEDPATLNDPNSLSSKQLARLRGKDDTAGKPEFDETRAYLAADGTCTTDTLPNFGRNASIVLDDGLPDA
jgi:hypothetical protein